jgi:DNA-nicking Smr family endonuclease
MSGGRNDEKGRSGRESFADHVGDVRPLSQRSRVQPPPEPRARPPRRDEPDRTLAIEQRDGRLEARAPDVSRARLADLRAGRIAPQRELDLHGLDLAGARRALAEALERALEDDLRCLLVIHGRGRRSPGAPVLRRAVPEWLAQPPHAAHVQAFATAPRSLGGAGACLVLLRRSR